MNQSSYTTYPNTRNREIVWTLKPIKITPTTPAVTTPEFTTPAVTNSDVTTSDVTTSTSIPVGTEANTPTWTEYISEDSRDDTYLHEPKEIDTSDQLDASIRKYYDNYKEYLKDHTNTTFDQYVGNQILKKDDSASAYIRKLTPDPKNNKVEERIKQHENLIDYFIQLFNNNS